MKHLLKQIVLAVLLSIPALKAAADQFSYVYIQGDKQTPFYVKFEDEMLPRYGKNYCIIPELTPGPIHIQILFQQNAYPAQKFTILVPEGGSRGFLLTRKGESFSLYDIDQQFYLRDGNSESEDRVPEYNNLQISELQASATAGNQEQLQPEATNLAANTPATTTTPSTTNQPGNTSPAFMDMELNNTRVLENDNTPKSDEDFKGKVAIVNSDCPHAIDNDLFDAIYKKAEGKPESARLKYLLDKTSDNCFTTNQIRILAGTLENDPERYTFLKKAYSRVTDQSVFPALENLLRSREWKDYFKLILP